MPQVENYPSASLALAAGLGMIALFLGLHQWYERRAREDELSEADRSHFARQDLRRRIGIGILIAIAALVLLAAYLDVPPHVRPSVFFPIVWIIVLGLIVALLTLALADLAATRDYARRHRKRIIRESIESIRLEARRDEDRPNDAGAASAEAGAD